MSIKDRNGYGISVGCFVKIEREHNTLKGWITEIDILNGIVWVRCSSRGGAPRPCDLEHTIVVRPSDIDKARAVGHQRTVEHASKEARRKSRLGRRTK